MKDKGPCPRCGKEMGLFPALSRRDNQTNICSRCGLLEALEDFAGPGMRAVAYTGPVYWEEKP